MRKTTYERRPTQTERLVELLRRRSPAWVPLAEILETRISQYNARLFSARHELSLNIENRTERIDGVVHSWYRLVEEKSATTAETPTETPSLFPDRQPVRYNIGGPDGSH